jgi:hypothetical protein
MLFGARTALSLNTSLFPLKYDSIDNTNSFIRLSQLVYITNGQRYQKYTWNLITRDLCMRTDRLVATLWTNSFNTKIICNCMDKRNSCAAGRGCLHILLNLSVHSFTSWKKGNPSLHKCIIVTVTATTCFGYAKQPPSCCVYRQCDKASCVSVATRGVIQG